MRRQIFLWTLVLLLVGLGFIEGFAHFGLPGSGDKLTLNPGDRLELPAGVSHNAVVGKQGVVCLEAHR
jgi:hypothetical protein